MKLAPFHTCPTCQEYGLARQPVLVPAMREQCDRSGETPDEVLVRYMTGVHQRHLAGLPIMPGQS